MFSEKVKNNILSNGYFYRIYYSDEFFTSNGLYILFNLKDTQIDKYFNKMKCTFNRGKNSNIISAIKELEVTILKALPTVSNRMFVCRIEEQLNNNFIKIFSNGGYKGNPTGDVNILLKVSGIWENDGEYGLTFRFFFNHPSEKRQ